MPTTCNRGFYCRSYCLLNMFRAPLCPSSGTQEYYTVVAACCISCCGFQVAVLVWSWGLCIRFAGCCWVLCIRFAGCCSILQTGHVSLSSTPDQQLENHSTKYHRQQPLYNTLELLMMGIVVPETCWASNKICNKNLCRIFLAFYFHLLHYFHYEISGNLCTFYSFHLSPSSTVLNFRAVLHMLCLSYKITETS